MVGVVLGCVRSRDFQCCCCCCFQEGGVLVGGCSEICSGSWLLRREIFSTRGDFIDFFIRSIRVFPPKSVESGN